MSISFAPPLPGHTQGAPPSNPAAGLLTPRFATQPIMQARGAFSTRNCRHITEPIRRSKAIVEHSQLYTILAQILSCDSRLAARGPQVYNKHVQRSRRGGKRALSVNIALCLPLKGGVSTTSAHGRALKPTTARGRWSLHCVSTTSAHGRALKHRFRLSRHCYPVRFQPHRLTVEH